MTTGTERAAPGGAPAPGTERATPFYCPYCADEDLRPVEESAHPAAPGAWRCTACLRVFVVKFVGLASRAGVAR
jgi:transposase-like protein